MAEDLDFIVKHALAGNTSTIHVSSSGTLGDLRAAVGDCFGMPHGSCNIILDPDSEGPKETMEITGHTVAVNDQLKLASNLPLARVGLATGMSLLVCRKEVPWVWATPSCEPKDSAEAGGLLENAFYGACHGPGEASYLGAVLAKDAKFPDGSCEILAFLRGASPYAHDPVRMLDETELALGSNYHLRNQYDYPPRLPWREAPMQTLRVIEGEERDRVLSKVGVSVHQLLGVSTGVDESGLLDLIQRTSFFTSDDLSFDGLDDMIVIEEAFVMCTDPKRNLISFAWAFGFD